MHKIPPHLDLSIPHLHQLYRAGNWQPSDCIEQILQRMQALDRPEVWITHVDSSTLRQQALQLDHQLQEHGADILARLPLFGIPFAVKDNIDVAGLPTTAACPAFAYTPNVSAFVVDKLIAAGALLIGKTNLDQFATGLVGTRSPYGAVRNALHPDYVSGGSSSGSAVAVALDLVSFALGTDTAGSGRVPAGFNNIIGLKPTRGLLSTRGVVAACRSLDCVSIFASSVSDAWEVTSAAAGYDAAEPSSRRIPMAGPQRRGYRIAIPSKLEFFGDQAAQQAFEATLEKLRQSPQCHIGEIDYAPFQQAASLLYQGPWVAERMASIQTFFQQHSEQMDPVVAAIINQAQQFSATDTFKAQYLLAELARTAEQAMLPYDFMLVPTTATFPSIAAVQAEPILRNSELGYYTNFVNFFDMAALAIPGLTRNDGLPAGVTLIGRCGADHLLAAAAEQLLPLWQAKQASSTLKVVDRALAFQEPTVLLAVVGAHLDGQPLNWQLRERGARQLLRTTTAATYRLHALANTSPPKPGLERVSSGGTAIEVEVWELPSRRFGEVVAEVSAPLAIGSLELADGRWVKGFVCEPFGLHGAVDISKYGGWRAFLASQ